MNQHVAGSEHWQAVGDPGGIARTPMSSAPTGAERAKRRDDVRRAVEADIVPRVLLAHRPAPHTRAAHGALEPVGGIGADEILTLIRLLLDHVEDGRVGDFLLAVQGRGVPLADIYLRLFQPAARHIGDLWADDRCSFVDVTLAVGTMQKMMRTFEPIFHQDCRPAKVDRQALLVPLPGDQHTFGLSMVTEFFRRAGWSVWNTPLASLDDLGEVVKTAWFALVGFSASTENRLDELATAIALVRMKSVNRAIGVMVGGPIFVAHPHYASRVGADALGEDADGALLRAEGFVTAAMGP